MNKILNSVRKQYFREATKSIESCKNTLLHLKLLIVKIDASARKSILCMGLLFSIERGFYNALKLILHEQPQANDHPQRNNLQLIHFSRHPLEGGPCLETFFQNVPVMLWVRAAHLLFNF